LNPQTKALAEGFLSGMAFLNQAQDFVADKGFAALKNAQSLNDEKPGWRGFAALGGGSLTHHTGSQVEVDGYTLIAGLAGVKETRAGTLTAGAFIEHGEGNYDSYNSFTNAAKIHGKGDTSYTGGGILARFDFNETLYLEASMRGGQIKTDFNSNLYDGFGRAAAYDGKSRYMSSHMGTGYLLNLNEQNNINLYAQYLWSHQDGDSVKLTTGETVKFKAVDSQRTRLGMKWTHTINPKTHAYLGAAWEHEYDGKANASIYGYRLDAPKLKGDTGMAEIGLTVTPAAHKAGWAVDLGVQGYDGRREGMTGSLRARYSF
jgi:hypothetical protein